MKGEVERRERKDPKVVKAMKEAKVRPLCSHIPLLTYPNIPTPPGEEGSGEYGEEEAEF